MQLSLERLLANTSSLGPTLGIDTGGPIASVGLVADGHIAATYVRSSTSHCAELPAMVAEVLDTADIRMADLSAVSVAIGPGSFTGLRVGVSYAKGLATARRIALVGVPSLDALALCAGSKLPQDAAVYSLIDARKGEVYAGLYRFSAGALERVSGELLVPL